MEQRVWERRDCVSAEVNNALVLLDLETLQYHSLNESAAGVWELLAEPKTVSQLTDDMCERYDVAPEVCSKSIDRLLAKLQEIGLVKSKDM